MTLHLISFKLPAEMWNNSSSPSPNCDTAFVALAMALSVSTFQALLIFPLSVYALIFGYQRWRLQRSFTNSDLFAYNMSAMHLLFVIGRVLYFIGALSHNSALRQGGSYVGCIIYPGELLVHSLTCVDRYMAVVHPIVYMKFKQNIGVCVRNVSISIVWLTCFGYMGLRRVYHPEYPKPLYDSLLVTCLFAVCYCCASVLCVLLRPKPGHSDRVDRSKRRAFHTMLAITAALLLWFVAVLINAVLEKFILDPVDRCVLYHALSWLNIPSSVVLYALLFHRAGKFTFSKK